MLFVTLLGSKFGSLVDDLKLMTRELLRIILFLGVICFGNGAFAAPKNFIIIMTDDQGWGDLSCFGSEIIATPHIDRMASEGLRMTSFYVASSVCSPSRAALLTGRMPVRVGVPGVLFPRSTTGLPPAELTIAELLKRQGYATGIVGKWLLGHQAQFMPMNQGFDSYYGVPYSNDMSISAEFDISPVVQLNEGYTPEQMQSDRARYLQHYRELRNRVPLLEDNMIIEYPVDQKTLTRRYTEKAVEFIAEHKEEPFFLYMPHTMPHKPHHIEEEYAGKSEAGIFGDIVQQIDWSVGEVLNALHEHGLSEDTFVIFLSDNGPIPEGSAGPMKGGKFTTFEGGLRVPAVLWAPGTIAAGGESDEIASTLDLLPTIAHWVGADLPEDRIYDGFSLKDLIEGRSAQSPRHEIFYYAANSETINGIRVGGWKYQTWGDHPRARPEVEVPKLYNLRDDIGEKHNVIEKYPVLAEKLHRRMLEFDAGVNVW